MAAKKENQRILLTKRLLQDGLLRLLETKDMEKISVTELCKEAGINRATFYNHYDSPLALLGDIEEHIRQNLEEIATVPHCIEDSVKHLEQLCIYMKENAPVLRILQRCHLDTELAYTFERVSKHPITSRTQDLDADSLHLISTYMFTGCYFLVREWLMNDMDKTPQEVAELAASIINKDYL